jgi:hypothetical protein
MNAEEFHGHIMAALHGPHAHEIVDRIAVVLAEQLATPAMQEVIGGNIERLLDAAIGDSVEAVTELMMIAHLSNLSAGQDVRRAMNIASARTAIVRSCRDRLRSRLLTSDSGKSVAARLFLSLDQESKP